ncbi:glycosyltransferase family 2 protein [Anaerovibrio lipolyticus]|uniref:glycosyltransferase family 2 protein n=1 Tax=Anaerovibrio lipolyticus TaxID=82374 RepID=UPI0026E9B79E|nr:glycosyltransferase family 2 protein [Anaerovibrio lipolyticus]MBE6105137.1 glycosyltransferase family 2 protein [Anaerovibrio lipolyticus]
MGIKISACVIVKNEEKNMPRWLNCMKNIADEIIVVDTGSTDNTVALAKQAGAQLYYFKWINDFAAAKNYAIEQATGDWIIFLDADESFTKAAQKVFRKELERFNRDKSVGCLLCRMLDLNADDNNRVFNTSLLPRIFRRSPYIRYKGAIHEQVENTQGNKKMVFAEKLEFIHTGYSSSIIRSKTERNLPIMLKELEQATTEAERRRLYPYLMDAYNSLADYDKTIYYAEKCIECGYKMVGHEGNFYQTIIMAMYNSERPIVDLLAKNAEAEKEYPEEAFFAFTKAMILERQGDLIGAEHAVLHGLELRSIQEKKLRQGIGVSDNSRGLLPYAYERLGNIYSLKGDKQSAAENYLLALKQHKYQGDSMQGLCRVLAGTDDVELIGLLNSLYDREKDGQFICKQLRGLAGAGVLSYYGRDIQGYEQGYVYMANGRYDSGGVKLGERFRELVQLGKLAADNMEEYPADGYLNVLVSEEYRALFGQNTKEAASLRRLKEYRARVGLD